MGVVAALLTRVVTAWGLAVATRLMVLEVPLRSRTYT